VPPATPSTDQLGVPPVAVNCCVCHTVIPAAFGETVTVPVAIETVAVAGALVPPGPVQVRV
jgi:hypothetical protein